MSAGTAFKRIGDLIEVPPVRTVIRLEEGRDSPAEIAASFVFTSEVSAHLTVIAEALKAGRGQGYFLEGDFGSGKSHFLAALYAWLSGRVGPERLAASHQGLSGSAAAGGKVLPVAVSLIDYRAATPLESILLGSIERSLNEALRPVSAAAQDRVEERKETFKRIFAEVDAAGFTGLMLLIDELSEFFRSKPTAQSLNEDARTLQLLGELSADRPLWIVAAVQESIEKTGDVARSTFRKIKDRFPVKLALSSVHIRALISERLVRKKPGAEEEIYRIYEDYRRQYPDFSSSFDEFGRLYPVHPATVSLLDGLGDLFSQHRGIVDFVCSRIAGDSRRGIPSILERPPRELLGPDSIYEHFCGRLAEFSAYNIYPRHIVPHLDAEIDRVFENGEDRHLARRLVRMLVLYRVHPTADAPNAGKLAELAACSLDAPQLSARFVAEAILDPLAAASRFLTKRSAAAFPATEGIDRDPALAVYEIESKEDSAKVLEARIRRLEEELAGDDSRLLLEPLLQLPESDSWPGPALGREGAIRAIGWNLSQRRALVRLQHREDLPPAGLAAELEARECDFALLLTLGEVVSPAEHIAIWRIPLPRQGEALEVLKGYLAVRLLQEELSASNPADAPLIPLAAERTSRLKPAAAQAALEAFYSGSFVDPRMRVDAAVRQLRRFESLLEAAGQVALGARYPRFPEVAPRRYPPSGRIYQQLLESFVIPGSLPLSQARPLSAAVDGLAAPLGLVEMKRGSYVFSPDISGHPLLIFFFELLRPSAAVALAEVLGKLKSGAFGLPGDTALFLIASLAAGGLITVRRGGRAVALEFLNLQNLEKADEISLGELIGENDRATLLEECNFLFSGDEPGSFGLRQQRDAWKGVVAFRTTAERLAADALTRLSQRREYSSFRGFPFTALEEKLAGLGRLAQEIRVSYPAKEGLEKFLSAWRSGGLQAGDVQFLKKLDRFLQREAEKLVFVHHYLHHEAVEKAAGLEPGLEALRFRILELLENPQEGVIPDEGAELDHLFAAFREKYIPLYSSLHRPYYESIRPPSLSKSACRALEVLRRLAGIEALDRPSGLDRFLSDLASPRAGECSRQVREELMRSPVCGCGFLPGQSAAKVQQGSPERDIDRYLVEYLGILRSPALLETLSSHAYAVQDLKPQAAGHLKELVSGLQSGATSAAGLVSALDEVTGRELAAALTGKVTLRRVSLELLVRLLAGRRLPADRILALVGEWLGKSKSGELVAVESAGLSRPAETDSLELWAALSSAVFPHLAASDHESAGKVRELETQLEQRFPAAKFTQFLRRMDSSTLLDYICGELLHTRAVAQAWTLLAERILSREAVFPAETGRTDVRAAAPPAGQQPAAWPPGAAGSLRSRHADPARAAEIEERLRLVIRIAAILELPFPQRLGLRPALEALLADPWTGSDLQARAADALREVQSLGQNWLDTLAPLEAIDLQEGPVVLLVDGVPPDIWLAAMDLIEAFPEAFSAGWARLEARPETVPATACLLGLEGDPLEALEARGLPFLHLDGREEEGLESRLASLPAGRAAVIRLGALDRGAHQGAYKLADLAARLRHLLEKELPALHRYCRERRQDLVLTTDHGLSLGTGTLSHGAGGVYERAIFRARWSFRG